MADGKTTLTKPMSGLLTPGEQLLGGCKASGTNAALKAGVGAMTSKPKDFRGETPLSAIASVTAWRTQRP
jgi:hypothetical protein